jgi:hypothetical protein
MSKKPKPRWGFKSVAEKIPIPKEKEEEIVKSINKKTGITLKINLANRLTESASEYLSTKEVIDNLPHLSEVRPALKKVRDCASELVKVLEQLDPISRTKLIAQSDWVDIEGTILKSQYIYYASEDALKNLPIDKRGPRPRLTLQFFIKELIEIYKLQTGKKKVGMPYKRKKYSVLYDEKTKKDIDPETKVILDEETAEKLWDEETILPDGPSFRFVSSVLEIIDTSITKATIFSAMKPTPKKKKTS